MRRRFLLIPLLFAVGCGGSSSRKEAVYPLSPYATLRIQTGKGANAVSETTSFAIQSSVVTGGTLTVESHVTSGVERLTFDLNLEGYQGRQGTRYAVTGGKVFRLHQTENGVETIWRSIGGSVVDRGSDGYYRLLTVESVTLARDDETGRTTTLSGELHVLISP